MNQADVSYVCMMLSPGSSYEKSVLPMLQYEENDLPVLHFSTLSSVNQLYSKNKVYTSENLAELRGDARRWVD